MAAKHMQVTKKNTACQKIKKNMILSIVALIEVILISVMSVSAWIETTSSLKITGTGTIDNRTYTVANIGSGSDYTEKIDLSDYFRESGRVHLAKASSADGENVYFPVVSSTSNIYYRKANLNDKNVNYISFSFNVHANMNTNFYFNQVPTIKIGKNVITDNSVRMAITAGNEDTVIYSNKAGSESVVSSVNGDDSNTIIKDFESYSNNGSLSLFSMNSGETKQVTITMWLQSTDQSSLYTGETLSIENFEIITSATKTTKLKFVDRTTKFNSSENSWNWIGNDEAEMWLYNSTLKQSVKMSFVSTETDAPTWEASVPQSITDDTTSSLYFYRCKKGLSSNPEIAANHYCGWKTTMSASNAAESIVYKAYGALDTSNMGFGTWGDVVEMNFFTEDTSVLPVPAKVETATPVTLKSVTSGTTITSEMCYNNGLWSCYLPYEAVSGLSNLTYSFTLNGKSYTYNAVSRCDSSKYVITSASTGYWDPPVFATVVSADISKGTVSVSGGKAGATTVKVTKGTNVTFTAEPKTGYKLEGWYTDSAFTKRLAETSNMLTEPITSSPTTRYAKFEVQTFTVTAHAVTDGIINNSIGGTVAFDSKTGASVSATVNYAQNATFTATEATGYTFEGWYTAVTGGSQLTTSHTYTKSNVTSSTGNDVYARFKKSTKTIYIGVAYYLKDNSTIDVTNLRLHYWKSDTDYGDVALTDTGKTYNYSPGSAYWAGAEQKFYMYSAEIPNDYTNIRLWNNKSGANVWYGSNTTVSSGNSLMLFEYSGYKVNQITYTP